MKNILAVLGVFCYTCVLAADPSGYDPNEVRLSFSNESITDSQQALLRLSSGWDDWNSTTNGWMTQMSERRDCLIELGVQV